MKPLFIESRCYASKVVNHNLQAKPEKTANTSGVWRVRYINRVPDHIVRIVECDDLIF